LLLGVQGAGKSLSAKAIATAWQRPLLRLDPGALYDRFVGESEHRLRDALKQAEMMAPIVLWIDEIEKGFASAASHSTDGGLSQRMFGTLLTWMQEHDKPVFLVATANDIDALPPELLRKGRFDEIFFVDLPGEKVREQIFAIHLTKRKRDPAKFDLKALAKASAGFSGAEIEQAVIAALHEAFAEKGEIDTRRVVEVLGRSPPLSVTAAERIAMLRDWARHRCVPAD
jgi:SpoVK/Ycf46/Vps4 family AAA+-type ATPase